MVKNYFLKNVFNAVALFLVSIILVPFVGNSQTTTTVTSTSVGSPFIWTCPAGVTTVTVECWGAGGCGSARTNSGQNAGGGGGAYASSVIAVVAGTNYNLVVGAGGTSAGTNSGGNSTFNGASVVATGGTGLANGVAVGGAGGLVGGCTGTTKFSGGTGGNPGGGKSGSGGGGAGSTSVGGNGGANGVAGTGTADNVGGNGGTGVNGNTVGGNGVSYGGGGAGGSRSTAGGTNGGNGADGALVLTYCNCATIIAQPTSETVFYSGTNTYFHVNISSPAGITYQWQRSADGGATWVNISSASMDAGTTYSDYTTATLFLAAVTPSVSGYKYRCIISGATCSITTDGNATLTVSAPQLCSDLYSRPITILNTMVGGGADLTNFPVLVNVTDLANLKFPGGHVSNANGYDIIFTDANGTPLNFQTELYNAAAGQYIGWVNVPTLSHSANTIINMFYGNAAVVTDQSSPITWDTNFVAVYHLNSVAGGITADGTVDALTGNAHTCATGAGQIANGVKSFSYVDAQGGASSVYNNVTQNITVSGWVKFATAGLDQKIAGSEDNANGGWKMGVFPNGGNNNVEFEIRTAAPGNAPYLDRPGQANLTGGPPTNLAINTWYYVVGQYNQVAGTIRTYVGGTANFTAGTADYGQNSAGIMGVSTGTLSLGCEAYSSGTCNWSGTLDEIRVSKIIRSVGWLQTEYNNQSNLANVTLGAEKNLDIWTGTGNWSISGTGAWSAGIPVAATNIVVSTGNLTVNSNVQVNSVVVKSGATLTIGGGNTLSVSTYVTNCGTITGAGTLAMNGTTTTNQNISGAGTYSVGGLVINNTTAGIPFVTLQSPVGVSGALTLTSGLLNTDLVNILTMQSGSTAPALTSAATSYVNGPMDYQKATAATATLNFPIGSIPDCRPFYLTVTHTTANPYNYTAQLFNGNGWVAMGSTLSSQMPSTVDTISGVHYWTINRTNGVGISQPTLELSGNQQIQLFFGTNDGVFQGSTLTIVKNTFATPASWIDIGGTSALGNFASAQAGSLTSSLAGPSPFNSFSTFTLGSLNTGWNPLPIQLLSFSAVPNDEKVDIKWETATEQNNAYFTIEKSKDGVNFTKLIDVPGADNSTTYRNYAETDYQPYSGTSYYRLKQTDYNNNYTYFTIVPVNFNVNTQSNIVVGPNPLNKAGKLNVKVTGYKNQEVVVVLQDMQGREFLSKVLLITSPDYQIFIVDETQSLAPGTYIVTATSNDKIYNFKLIVRD